MSSWCTKTVFVPGCASLEVLKQVQHGVNHLLPCSVCVFLQEFEQKIEELEARIREARMQSRTDVEESEYYKAMSKWNTATERERERERETETERQRERQRERGGEKKRERRV